MKQPEWVIFASMPVWFVVDAVAHSCPTIELIAVLFRYEYVVVTLLCWRPSLQNSGVCSAHDPQSWDFSLICSRLVQPGEVAAGPNKHLVLNGSSLSGAVMKDLGEEYGVLARDVIPAAIAPCWWSRSHGAAGEDDGGSSVAGLQWPAEKSNQASKRTAHFLVPPPPPANMEDGACVTLLWGLTHCVNAAFERLVALRSSQLVVSVSVGSLLLSRLDPHVCRSYGEAKVI